MSEQVARLVKEPARGSSFLGDPDFPFEGTLGVGHPGMDDVSSFPFYSFRSLHFVSV